MNLTPEQYAEIVISKAYKVENTYNLAKAIARVADKYAKWVMEYRNRQHWATDGTPEQENYIAQKQQEAFIKREAYRLALITLTNKVPK